MIVAAALLALLAARIMRPDETTPGEDPVIRVEYVTDMRPALARTRASTGVAVVPAPPPEFEPAETSSPAPLFPAIAELAPAGDGRVVELGHPEGDFVWRPETGWLKLEPPLDGQPGPPRERPIDRSELPTELAKRYPAALYPSRGRSGRETRSAPGDFEETDSVPVWELNAELFR